MLTKVSQSLNRAKEVSDTDDEILPLSINVASCDLPRGGCDSYNQSLLINVVEQMGVRTGRKRMCTKRRRLGVMYEEEAMS